MRYAVSLLVCAALAGRADAQFVAKLGTLAPQGSAWHELLRDLGRRWDEASGGQVRLRIYAGGVQGNEGEMIRKLGIGQLQAAALSNVGMHDIARERKALSIPLFFRTEAEAECTFEAVRGSLEATLAARGYQVAHWSRIGALHLFCTSPYRTPAEMATARFFTQPGDSEAAKAWRAVGFRTVDVPATDLYPALQTGTVECAPSLPLYVLTARLHEKARYMTDLPWIGAAADAEVRRMNADALAGMQRQGLTIVHVDPAPWHDALRKAHAMLRGPVVPAPFFDEISHARDACRATADAARAR